MYAHNFLLLSAALFSIGVIAQQSGNDRLWCLSLSEQIECSLSPLGLMPMLRTKRTDVRPHIGHDFADRRVFAGDGRPADSGFRINGDDGKRRRHTVSLST